MEVPCKGESHPMHVKEHTSLFPSEVEHLRGTPILDCSIVDNEINPFVDKWESDGSFPAHDVFKKLGNAGLLGVTKDQEYGGLGLDYTFQIAVLEELGHINCAGVTTAIGVQTDMSTPALSRFGSEKLKKEFLAPSIAGDIVSCIGVSETTGGSDVAVQQEESKYGISVEIDNVNSNEARNIELTCFLNAMPVKIAQKVDLNRASWKKVSNIKAKLKNHIQKQKIGIFYVADTVVSLKTNAKRRGDDLVINGHKMWITNAYQADWICLLANTSEGASHKNKSLICVPMNAKGITLTKKIDKLGLRSSDTGQIFFEDVHVPVSNIIGEEGYGFMYQMMQFQEERLAAAILLLTPLEKVLNQTIEYCESREAFGYPILYNQSIHFRLAELATELELFKALVYRTINIYKGGQDVTMMASMCKLKGGRLARELVDSCLQFWGGMGFTNEVFVSRMYRDLRLISIGGGTDEIMLNIICKKMGILPPIPKFDLKSK
ncbi:putative acyl-CoA dehydrogenase 6 [Nymphon striatum]|nr:putative acyl-CoA dehydrogenase 6 [Nymphon striatum]